MGRFEGPVRFRFNGDPELARQYMALGRKLLGGVIEEISRTNLPELSRIFRTQDGTTIVVRSGYGENSVDITREEVEPQIEILLQGQGFVTVPASDDAPNGWGEPFFDGEGNPINPPLGTPGGQYPVTWLDYDTEEGDPWVAKRYPDYQNIWPTGLRYGQAVWVSRRGNESFVLSCDVSSKRYSYDGNVYGVGDIFFRGNRLCSPPSNYFIFGVCVQGDFLVGAFERIFQGIRYGLVWFFRPFNLAGYPNDDFYDPETNPNGWRECLGDQSNPEITIARMIQLFSFNTTGTRAVVNYLGDALLGCCLGNVRGGDWEISITMDNQISVSFTGSEQGEPPDDLNVRLFTAFEECFEENLPDNEDESWHLRDQRMDSKGYTLTLFREYAPDGSIVGQVVTLKPGFETFFDREDRTESVSGVPIYTRLESRRAVSISARYSMGESNAAFYTLSNEIEESTIREASGYPLPDPLPIVSRTYIDNSEHQYFIIDWNLSVGYALIVEIWREEFSDYISRFYVRNRQGEEFDLFTIADSSPLFFSYMSDASFLRVNSNLNDNPGFTPSPPNGICPNPSVGESIQESWGPYNYNNVQTDTLSDSMAGVYQLAVPFYLDFTSDILDVVNPEDQYEYSFGAYHDGIGNEICTAWVRWIRDSVEHFGTFDYISDGNLSELTQVTGPNARHIQTGVI